MAQIKSLKQNGETLYPRTSTKAVLDDSGDTVESRLSALEASSGAVEVDTTLSESGKAADAKATGDKVQEVAQSVATLNTSVTAMGTTVNGLGTSVANMDTRVTALEGAGSGGGGWVAVTFPGDITATGEDITATGQIGITHFTDEDVYTKIDAGVYRLKLPLPAGWENDGINLVMSDYSSIVTAAAVSATGSDGNDYTITAAMFMNSDDPGGAPEINLLIADIPDTVASVTCPYSSWVQVLHVVFPE